MGAKKAKVTRKSDPLDWKVRYLGGGSPSVPTRTTMLIASLACAAAISAGPAVALAAETGSADAGATVTAQSTGTESSGSGSETSGGTETSGTTGGSGKSDTTSGTEKGTSGDTSSTDKKTSDDVTVTTTGTTKPATSNDLTNTKSASDVILAVGDTGTPGVVDAQDAINAEPINHDDYKDLGFSIDDPVGDAQTAVTDAQAKLAAATTEEEKKAAQAELDQAQAQLQQASDAATQKAAETAPYSTDHATTLIDPVEYYVEANGAIDNKYTVRDGFDLIDSDYDYGYWYDDDYGKLDEAYEWYGINRGGLPSDFDADASAFSSNKGNVLSKADAGFSGLYATSTAFSHSTGEDATKSWVAELRAYGAADWQDVVVGFDTSGTVTFEGQVINEYVYNLRAKGKIAVDIFSFDAKGNRTLRTTLYPTISLGQLSTPNLDDNVTVSDDKLHLNGTADFLYVNAGYNQEYDAYFEIEAADVDGDGADEIFTYTGAYEDKGGIRYAIVDMFKFDVGADGKVADNAGAKHYTTSIACGKASEYLDSLKAYKGNYAIWEVIKRAPVVTLASGDVDRDGKDELAVCASAPTGHTYAADAAHGAIYKWNKTAQALETFTDLDSIDLFEPDANGDGIAEHAMVSANVTFGTFAVPNTTHTADAFIFAGYQTNDGDQTALAHEPLHERGDTHPYSKFAYRALYYDTKAGKWVLTDYTAHSLGKDGKRITGSYTPQGNRYVPVFAPIALACANLWGTVHDPQSTMQDPVQNDSVLIAGDVYRATLTDGRLTFSQDPIGSMSLCAQHPNHRGNTKGIDHIWIGDVTVGVLSDMQNDTSYGESFLAVEGFHRQEDIWKDDDYYWYDIAHFSYQRVRPKDDNNSYTVDGKVLTSQEGVICESNRRSKNAKYGTYISLAVPEVNGDAIRMRFKEAAQLYTEPTVLAILQDAPYYGDLQDAKHYLVLGGTEMGTAHTDSASTKGFSVGMEAGFYVEGSVGFLAHMEFEGEITATGSYEQQTRETQEFAITFESHAGEGNKVVLYVVPITYYHYEVFDPQSKTWKDVVIPQLGTATYALLSAERYDEIVEQVRARWNKEHPGKAMPYNLPLVSEVLTSKSGEPGTYTSAALGGDKATEVYRSKAKMKVTNSAGGTTGQDISIEKEDENSYEIGGAINGRIGWEIGFLGNGGGAGIVVGGDAAYTHFSSTGVGTKFGGTVDNLPESANDYYFDWQLVANVLPDKVTDKKLDTSGYVRYVNDDGTPQGIWLVGFEVTNMKQPKLPMVHNFTLDEVKNTEATVSWDPVFVSSAALQDYHNLNYRIYFVNSDGTLSLKTSVPYTTTEKSVTTLTHEATVKGLTPNASYRLVVQLAEVDANNNVAVVDKVEQASVKSVELTFRTLPDGEVFSVAGMEPNIKTVTLNDDGTYTVTDDGKASESLDFTVTAKYGKNGQPIAGKTPTFEWQYSYQDRSGERKDWKTVWKTIGNSTADNKYATIVWPSGRTTTAQVELTADADNSTTVSLHIDPTQLDVSDSGTWFRCRVSYDQDVVLNSSESQLIVKSTSAASETARAKFTTTHTGARMLPLRASHKVATNAFALVSDVTPVVPDEPDNPDTPSTPDTPEAPAGTTGSPTTAAKQAGTKAASTTKAEAIPQTGDATPRGGLVGLLAAAGAALVGLARRRRHQSEED